MSAITSMIKHRFFVSPNQNIKESRKNYETCILKVESQSHHFFRCSLSTWKSKRISGHLIRTRVKVKIFKQKHLPNTKTKASLYTEYYFTYQNIAKTNTRNIAKLFCLPPDHHTW